MKPSAQSPTFGSVLADGLRQAPPFRLLLGLCPSLAVTTAMENGFWMGLAVIFVLACSELIISLLRKVIPDRVRIPVYIVIVATFVTVVDMVMKAYLPEMHAVLGIFIPLIVVNCIILGRAEAFASKNGPLLSVADAVGVGLGFTASLMAIGGVRELLGTGNLKLFGVALLGPGLPLEVVVMLLPAGAFFVIGFLMAGLAWLQQRQEARARRARPTSGPGSTAGAGTVSGGEEAAV
ncbi:MAG: electron transport complex subunit RsxE [Symbiobacterium thermophilum]|uniref:Ion-translocating oxidoreductase complex subunit E n=1 Tax=Symbiobacterium thermophilum TaxID=2734 RepID=A0A1Y2T6D2_SYMTR|nr:MAG: electron transport complex subunit RsxE [Symbiobacterium thermophilum]